MWFCICAIVICVVAFVIWDLYDGFGFSGFTVVCGILGMLLGTLIGLVTWAGASCIPGPVVEVSRTSQEICSLQDNLGVEGHMSGNFLFSSGSVDSKIVYCYAYKDENQGYNLEKVDAEKSVIYYIDPSETPRIDTVKEKFSDPIHRFFGEGPGLRYEIYVPDGTLEKEYKVDLQ